MRNAAKRAERRRGLLASAFSVLVMMGVIGGVGFLFGRYVVGEAYLKQSIAATQIGKRIQPGATRGGRGQTAEDDLAKLTLPLEEGASAGDMHASAGRQPTGSAPDAGAEPSPTPEASPPIPEEEVAPDAIATLSPSSEDLKTYSLQVGLFARKENAQALLDDLHRNGFPGRIEAINQGGTTLHRVSSGPYWGETAAREAVEELKADGFQAVLLPSL